MTILIAIFGFILGMLILVVVHEWGHYWVAKKLGVKILRFSVGFGRPLWLRRFGKDQTEWVIAAIPLGGFVRMLDENEGNVSEAELPRAFNRQALWKRTLIVLAGPVANLLLAFVLFAGMLMWGVPQLKPITSNVEPASLAAKAGFRSGDVIKTIDSESVQSWSDVDLLLLLSALDQSSIEVLVKEQSGSEVTKTIDFSKFNRENLGQNFSKNIGLSVIPVNSNAVIGGLLPKGPAERAGMQIGDKIIAIDGVPVKTWDEMAGLIQGKPGQSTELQVRRGEQLVNLQVKPDVQVKNGKKFGRIGVGQQLDEHLLQSLLFTQRLGLANAGVKAWQQGSVMTRLTLKMIGGMIGGYVSTKNISGPVGIATIAGDSVKAGMPSFILFLVVMSLSLGIMNLLPIPVLDGGHLVYYLAEAIRGKPLSERTLLVAQRLGIAVLGLLTLLAFYNDFHRMLLSH